MGKWEWSVIFGLGLDFVREVDIDLFENVIVESGELGRLFDF